MKLKSTLLVAFATIGLASCFSSTGGSFRPSSSYFRKALKTVRPVLDGLRDLKNVATGQTTGDAVVLKAENEILMKECNERCARINALEPAIEVLSDAELRAKTKAFQARLASGAKLDDLLEEAFAVVREASWRVLELRHYDVQMVGGMVLFAGRLAEMATGEGKTLAATLPTYLAALEGKGALVVTANEYLARRDAETVGQVYRFLGLSVGLIQATLLEEDRKEEYLCDVTYVTNSELGFDYLRDNLALTPDALVTRSSSSSQTQVDQGLEPSPSNRETTFCLVDEADSILIDEARTPLIISKQVSAPADKYGLAAAIATVLEPSGKNQNPDADLVKTTVAVNEVLEQVFQSEGKGSIEEGDYEVDIKGQQLTLTDRGFAKAEKLVGKSLFDASDPWAPFIVNALKAKALFEKDKQYIVKAAAGEVKGEICIVDTFSGRVMEGRRWSDGLHQSIEAKEGIPVSTESQVIATVTYQSLFRRYPRLCGMSGTASSDAKEFGKVYGLQVTSIPSALPLARRDYPDVVYKTSAAKVRAVVSEVARAARSGRPVLVGTSSVDDSEALAERIAAKLGPEAAAKQLRVLNAKPENVDKEGEVVAQAGRLGAVTVATNMAGRGTDILLGGNSGLMAKLRVRDGLVARGVLAQGVTPPTPMDDVSGDAAGGASGEGEGGGDSAAVAAVSFFPCPLSAVALSAISEAAALVLAAAEKTDILLGGNSGLMAKLRVRDGLVASGVLAQGVTPPTPMDDVSAGEGGDSAAVATVSFFPCPLSAVALSAISEAAALVLADCREEEEEDEGAAGVVGLESVLELEELVSIAAERAPLRDPTVLAIRKAINLAKADFSATLAPEKEEVRKLGGLYVVGTERHESKRIDNQLRGR
eukprot:CAMPEP_0171994548 /NCGR_PEP_ID=MMETSP0993-20121228/279011_1 /TAXON_ID=483369 /ORGANISM="non described non described, Strain CCMP2098" /LENGTH=878 /DNA_ID=CAMNT_0012647627 /DNA_START=7 /DNA_END=2640 /DNA_ORIENTATION=+